MTGPVVVVLFGADQTNDEHRPCDLSHCPMEAYVFDSGDEAAIFMARQPEWMHAHKLYGKRANQ